MTIRNVSLLRRSRLAAAMILRQSPALRSTRRDSIPAAAILRPLLTSCRVTYRCGLVMKTPAKLDVDFARIVEMESTERQTVVEQDSPVRHV